MPDAMRQAMRMHVHEQCASEMPDAMHERTNELTNAEATYERDHLAVRNAPTRMARIYLVEWPHFSFAKIGVTTRERWTGFASRGGVLRYLTEPASPQDALTREAAMHREIRSFGWPRAFECKETAVPFLGCGGAGWTECYRLGEGGPHGRLLYARLYAIDQLDEAGRRRA